MHSFSKFSQRLKNRADSEHEQAIIRVALVSIIFLWFFYHDNTTAYQVCLTYLAVAVLLFGWISIHQKISPVRRIIGAIGDMSAISAGFYIADETAAPLLAAYLWVITGNGFRYSPKYLIISAILACGGFIIAASMNPFWSQHLWFSFTIILSLMIAPIYMISLIKKMRHAIDTAEAANRAKSQFIANMSHELRTPLNGMLGMNDLLLSTQLSSEQQRFSFVIKESAYHLLGLIERLLDQAKIDAGKLEIVHEPFDFHQLLQSTVAMFEGQATEKKLRLMLHVDPEVPYALIGDPKQIKQILLNIIGNAVKFTNQGSVTTHISLLPDHQADHLYIRFQICDTGIGMSKKAQATVFEHFSQADASITRRFGGTGLGTTIAKSLTEMMGGTIKLHSTVGEGTTFTIELPFKRQPENNSRRNLSQVHILLLGDQTPDNPLHNTLKLWHAQYHVIEDEKLLLSTLVDALSVGQAYDILMINRDSLNCTPELIARAVRDKHEFSNLDIILIEPNLTHTSDPRMIQAGYSSVLHMPVQESLLFNALHVSSVIHHSPDVISLAEVFEQKTGLQPLYILLAEDNPVNQEVMREILKRAGHRLDIVNDGEEALDALASDQAYDLIILDKNMPKVSGLDVLKQFRFMDTTAKTPVLMLSADVLPETIRECIEAGADDYLSKPIQATLLLEKIATYAIQTKANTEPDIQKHADISHAKDDHSILSEANLNNLFSLIHSHKNRLHLIHTLERTSKDNLAQLETFASQGNSNNYLLTIHNIKGSAAMLGVQGVVCICEEIEDINTPIQQVEMAQYCKQLDIAFQLGYEALYAYIQPSP
ncbi:MAG: response regulator [Mariprofundus sp.]|nr:response regulator [Mariprofundus sp.]